MRKGEVFEWSFKTIGGMFDMTVFVCYVKFLGHHSGTTEGFFAPYMKYKCNTNTCNWRLTNGGTMDLYKDREKRWDIHHPLTFERTAKTVCENLVCTSLDR
uniref:Uncharacterized protein n=1 Tax=Davidia involucrata TaxID=16924 RepID=A0A5B7AN89_DAVIN